MKLILVLPSQANQYSNLYEVFADLNSGLTSIGIESKIVEVKMSGDAVYPFGSVERIKMTELFNFFSSQSDRNTVFVTVDDHNLVKWLSKNKKIQNLVIWAHYFYGARYIFQSYRNSNPVFSLTFMEKLRNLLASMIPNFIARRVSGFYWKALCRYPVFSQSIWTGLLLERVFSIPVLGTILIPVEQSLYNFQQTKKRYGILVFLGNSGETDLASLFEVLHNLEPDLITRLDYFGNEKAGKIFCNVYGIKMNFIGKVSRKNLLRAYSEHMITITPIFDGNFEMVPIQSLLCGTPVISFAQPFLEIIGQNDMIANIRNIGEIKYKVKLWRNLDQQVRKLIRTTIFEKMDNKKVAKDLIFRLESIGFH